MSVEYTWFVLRNCHKIVTKLSQNCDVKRNEL
jgi:hypothetical protein